MCTVMTPHSTSRGLLYTAPPAESSEPTENAETAKPTPADD